MKKVNFVLALSVTLIFSMALISCSDEIIEPQITELSKASSETKSMDEANSAARTSSHNLSYVPAFYGTNTTGGTCLQYFAYAHSPQIVSYDRRVTISYREGNYLVDQREFVIEAGKSNSATTELFTTIGTPLTTITAVVDAVNGDNHPNFTSVTQPVNGRNCYQSNPNTPCRLTPGCSEFDDRPKIILLVD